MQQDNILIKAKSKRNAYSLVLLGIISLLITLLLIQHYWQAAKLVLIFITMVSVVTIFIGAVKILEPDYSLTLTQENLSYQHKYGQWQLAWSNISYIGQVCESYGIERLQLPYVGFKLKDLSPFIDNISPRLASRLIHEQRPLIHFCLQHELSTYEKVMINFSPFTYQGKKITGPKAAYLHQMQVLKKALGYDVYIPLSALNSSCEDFVTLTRKYLHQPF